MNYGQHEEKNYCSTQIYKSKAWTMFRIKNVTLDHLKVDAYFDERGVRASFRPPRQITQDNYILPPATGTEGNQVE